MRAHHAVFGVVQLAVFDHQRDFPELLGDFIAGFRGQGFGFGIQTFDHGFQAVVGFIIGKDVVGLVGYGFQDLQRGGGVGARPQDVAAHLDQGIRQWVEKAFARQDQVQRVCGARVACGVGDGIGDGDGQVRQHGFGQIIDQGGFDVSAAAFERQRQVEGDGGDGFGVGFQTVGAGDGGEVQRDGDFAFGDAVVILRRELLFEAAFAVAGDLGGGGDRWGRGRGWR